MLTIVLFNIPVLVYLIVNSEISKLDSAAGKGKVKGKRKKSPTSKSVKQSSKKKSKKASR